MKLFLLLTSYNFKLKKTFHQQLIDNESDYKNSFKTWMKIWNPNKHKDYINFSI